MIAFDLACLFTGGDSRTILLLLLIKACQLLLANSLLHYGCQAIALFNANEHEEAMLRVKELVRACTNADILACHIVEVSIIHSFKPGLCVNTNFRNSGVPIRPTRGQCVGSQRSC